MAEAKICVCPQCGKKFKVSADAAAASFACSACGATVWIDGKPKVAPSGRRSKASGGKASGGRAAGGRAAPKGRAAGKTRGGRGAGKAEAAAPAGRAAGRGGGGRRGGRAHDAGFTDEDGQHHGRRYRKKEDNTNVIIAVIGLVVIIGLVAFFLMSSGNDPKPTDGTQEQASNNSGSGDTGTGMTDTTGGTETPPANAGTGTTDPGTTDPGTTDPGTGDTGTTDPAKTDGTGDAADSAAKTDTPKEDDPKKLTSTKSKYKTVNGKRVRISRYNPPEDLEPHLDSTPADKRAEIDKLIDTLFDPDAGKDSHDAKAKLILIGKPAFIPLLARMVKTKKLIKWDNGLDDRLVFSSVRLADVALRNMDGWIEAQNVRPIFAGTDEKYYDYVLRIYYRRWLTELKDMETMPGPYDPTVEYEKNEEEED